MLVHATHRPAQPNAALGHIQWYKEFRDHEHFHGGKLWFPSLYLTVMITKGRVRYCTVKGMDIECRDGDLLFIFPHLGCSFNALEGYRADFVLLGFVGDVFKLWEDSGLLNRENPVMHLGNSDYWKNRLMSIPLTDDPLANERDLVEVCRLQQFLTDARLQAADTCIAPEDSKWKQEVLRHIGQSNHHTIDLNEIAQRTGMHYEAFRKRFRKVFRTSPKRFHNKLIADKACEMIQTQDMNNLQIAEALGFCDEFYFSRFFKRAMGMSPREYRHFIAREVFS